MNEPIKETRPQKLERLWAEFLSKSPNSKQFREVARIVPDLRDKAWKKYSETKPPQAELLGLLNEEYLGWSLNREYPASLLMELYPSEEVFFLVMGKVPKLQINAADRLLSITASKKAVSPTEREPFRYIVDKVKDEGLGRLAAEKLLECNWSISDLMLILVRVPSLAERVGNLLLEKVPDISGKELVAIMGWAPSLVKKAWEKVKALENDMWPLEYVVTSLPKFRLEAAQLILAKSFNPDELFSHLFPIAKHVPELREAVWERLQTVELSNAWLEALARECPELKVRALGRKKNPGRTSDAVYWEILQVNSCG